MLIDSSFTCAYCLRENDTVIDPSGGEYQEYVEDCQICCRPNRLIVTVSPSLEKARIDTHPA